MDEINQCQIKAKTNQLLKSETSQRIAKIYGCKLNEDNSLDSRADVQIIIGKDYWKELNQR